MAWAEEALAVGAALAAGMLIGIERGWMLRDEPSGSRVAGVRTFALLGLLGGIAGLFGSTGQPLVAAALAASAAAIVAAGYIQRPDNQASRSATSAIAALIAIALGFAAGSGRPALAVACAALVTLLLALRNETHEFLERLDREDVKALARFAVIAGAILPFLPNRLFGPYDAWNPQKLWLVVVLVTGFSFVGYVANRIFGARRGTIATAVIGGAYSSTAVTQSLAQRLGSGKGGGAEPAGIALTSAVMYLRVTILIAVLATSVLKPFVIVILPALVTGAAAGFWLYRTAPKSAGPVPPGNPIALMPALAFLLFVAGAAVVVRWAEGRFGQQGIAMMILIIGSMDVDVAIVTVAGLKPGVITPELAALALGGTILANMAVKLGITLAYARAKGIAAACSLAASMVALTVSLAVGWLRL